MYKPKNFPQFFITHYPSINYSKYVFFLKWASNKGLVIALKAACLRFEVNASYAHESQLLIKQLRLKCGL